MKLKQTFVTAAVFLGFTLSLASALGGRDESPSDPALAGKKMTVTGTVVIFGNEPHTYAAIRSSDGKHTYAVYPAETEKKIWNLQSDVYAFKVVLLDKPAGEGSMYLKDGTVRVLSWKIVK